MELFLDTMPLFNVHDGNIGNVVHVDTHEEVTDGQEREDAKVWSRWVMGFVTFAMSWKANSPILR